MRQWVGRLVRSTRVFSNELGEVSAGHLFRVVSVSRGLSLESAARCHACGFRFRVCRVRPEDLYPALDEAGQGGEGR